MIISRWSPFALLVICLGLTACGGGDPVVEVKGKILKGGQPIPVPEKLPPGDQGLVVRFISTSTKSDTYSAKVDTSTGNFTVPGADGRGIKPGSYQVEVQVGPFGKDELKGKFSAAKTPITRTVEAGKEIEIDLDKPNN